LYFFFDTASVGLLIVSITSDAVDDVTTVSIGLRVVSATETTEADIVSGTTTLETESVTDGIGCSVLV
jgi:hypothetical protein